MWLFKKKQEEELNVPNSILEAMRILEKKEIRIKNIEVSKKLAERMEGNRNAVDIAYKKEPLLLLNMDTEFACFLHKNQIPKRILKNKPKNFIGMIFGIIISEKK